ncbi:MULTISPECIES: glutamine-hydrolyzing carbamoyl-phosphate synthase small subunit [unclassified Granulicatella]|uniref:glutamine-hydrolyzing carbamoyl-phosphate synthase small subunit n=1 Tax=unclassified Granulicatella TaxID=2630493 RepID=UPI0010737743|nr:MULTISPECIES: glutamine-hydrolyzing carbamoyl-phosphate synthase small subunit [unclassified Granulicatella]MBF0780705.1 glutamine-hydrolyzing carbamoyl-phosphate synthase small subunit [Granulicatella sp. 19428wC4_WM01]TFU94200.1 glutamine-hydrolyzing carbamoyl-phosphate synthase small subunit [Granulicatella sp. WM01]
MFTKQLVLQDGTIYKGYAFGAETISGGEVVFNTAMTGYQETLSDPSYNGQIVTFTYPLIGNYGINRDDFETINPSIKGMIVRELCHQPSNFRTHATLDETLKVLNIPGISGIDTRSLTRKIRQYGVLKGYILNMTDNVDEYIQKLQSTEFPTNQIEQVSTKTQYLSAGRGNRVVLIDLGMKSGILRELNARDCDIVIVPHDTSAKAILNLNPDGVMISNGPGDPVDVPETIQTIKELIGKVPIFGICMGHQLIGLACGAKTYKLKFGHRGANHPVKNILTGKVDLTSQNHGYSVDIDSLENTDLLLTHVAVNDGTCEGLHHKKYPVFSVQYHPEACPGPHDPNYLFDQFITYMQEAK